MFGRNEVVKPEYGDGRTLRVKEIFGTIQGEGPRVGEPAVFIRLAGCNLRCWFCDTDFEHGKESSLDEIMRAVKIAIPYGADLVVITGGEPLAQQLGPLCDALGDMGNHVQIETAGTCWPPGTAFEYAVEGGRVEIVCSPKTPRLHPMIIEHACAWKYIVRSGELSEHDGLPLYSTQLRTMLSAPPYRPQPGTRPRHVYLQPMMEYDSTGAQDIEATQRNLTAAAEACMRHGYRLSIQVHKIAGLP